MSLPYYTRRRGDDINRLFAVRNLLSHVKRVSEIFAMLHARRLPAALRRMKLEELIAKLGQIEEQASLTLTEYPQTLTLERARL